MGGAIHSTLRLRKRMELLPCSYSPIKSHGFLESLIRYRRLSSSSLYMECHADLYSVKLYGGGNEWRIVLWRA